MKLNQLLSQIEKLKGIWLSPLGRARKIKVREVDRGAQRVVVEVEGSTKLGSRSFSEFEVLLEAMNSTPAVHVDSALGGSGTSRNQPETILANLPGIEYLRIDGRKHLARVSGISRPYGTTQEMDPINAAKLASLVDVSAQAPPVGSLIVDSAHVALSKALSATLSCTSRSLSEDVILVGSGVRSLLVASPRIGLPEGRFVVINSGGGRVDAASVELAGSGYELRMISGVPLLLRVSRE